MFKWWVKTKKEETKEDLVVPCELVREIFVLYDKYVKEETRVAKYDLWNAIAEIFPETEGDGQWRITFPDSLSIVIKRDYECS